ncbi:hypothetical protein FJR45_06210 [Sulfurimonas sediminis]|uniref:Uncharacterized protein n=1 Tax=Sulfurimonas sediminis TaxID=2590020 RepID=A0A7M1B1B5_9BACT|nr:hypothetical protein [Sulfurimonas sediminis]QOP43567.1 hypothetical protein FJR45_06210 [Sulfurimonas sediminis]
MTANEKYEVITYEENIVFNFTLPEDGKENQLSKEVTLVWDDVLEKFLETFTQEKSYTIHLFKHEKEKNRFIENIENVTEEIIDQIDEEISQKMKFGFDYTSPTYED